MEELVHLNISIPKPIKKAVKDYAEKNRIMLGKAAELLLEAGIKAMEGEKS